MGTRALYSLTRRAIQGTLLPSRESQPPLPLSPRLLLARGIGCGSCWARNASSCRLRTPESRTGRKKWRGRFCATCARATGERGKSSSSIGYCLRDIFWAPTLLLPVSRCIVPHLYVGSELVISCCGPGVGCGCTVSASICRLRNCRYNRITTLYKHLPIDAIDGSKELVVTRAVLLIDTHDMRSTYRLLWPRSWVFQSGSVCVF